MSTFLFFQPAMLLSGFVCPIANMPPVMHFLTYVNPLQYFLVIIRGIFLKGNDFGVLWLDMLALLLLGSLVFGVSTLRFQKRLA
jgi:ABC-2 type transport system permease protein